MSAVPPALLATEQSGRLETSRPEFCHEKRGILTFSCVNTHVSRQAAPLLDEEELIRTYKRTIRPLYVFVSRRVGGDAGLAEDLVQEAWMRALEAWPAHGMPDEPLAWLIRVAHNTLVSYFRRSRPELVDPASIDLEAAGFSPDAADTAAVVSWGLARLRRAHADLLEAFYFDGKSVRDIARERSWTERAVEGRLRRARAKLKKKLERIVRPPAMHHHAADDERTGHARHTRTP